MAEAERVVEEIREGAAAEVAQVAVAGDAVIAQEVAQVGDDLADHAELSEERHEEILEAGSWVGQRVNDVLQNLQTLNTSMGALQAQLSNSQQATVTNLQLLQTILESRLPLSPGSTPSIPPVSNETVIAVVEPTEASIEEGQREAETPPPKRKRRII
jgi:hypothetical protein